MHSIEADGVLPSEIVKQKWLAGSERRDQTFFPWDREKLKLEFAISVPKKNPKDGRARERLKLYEPGMTIAAYVAAVVQKGRAGDKRRITLDDVCWDWNHKFMQLDPPPKK